MARNYTAGSSQRYKFVGAPATGQSMSMSAWVRTPATGTARTILCLGDSVGGVGRYQINVSATEAPTAAIFTTAGTFAIATHGSALVASVWQHILGVFTDDSSRTVYLNGLAPVSNTTTRTGPAVDAMWIGARFAASAESQFMGGDVAELAVWEGAALNAFEAQLLGAGYSPELIRRRSLSFYDPMPGFDILPKVNTRAVQWPVASTSVPILAPDPPWIIRRANTNLLRSMARNFAPPSAATGQGPLLGLERNFLVRAA